LIFAPDLADTYRPNIECLGEYLELVSFCLAEQPDGSPISETARRPLYEHTLDAVRELERRGLTVLIGYIDAPHLSFPKRRICTVSLTSRLTDPRAPQRKTMFDDKSALGMENFDLVS
jgi:hypothetical protein